MEYIEYTYNYEFCWILGFWILLMFILSDYMRPYRITPDILVERWWCLIGEVLSRNRREATTIYVEILYFGQPPIKVALPLETRPVSTYVRVKALIKSET